MVWFLQHLMKSNQESARQCESKCWISRFTYCLSKRVLRYWLKYAALSEDNKNLTAVPDLQNHSMKIAETLSSNNPGIVQTILVCCMTQILVWRMRREQRKGRQFICSMCTAQRRCSLLNRTETPPSYLTSGVARSKHGISQQQNPEVCLLFLLSTY